MNRYRLWKYPNKLWTHIEKKDRRINQESEDMFRRECKTKGYSIYPTRIIKSKDGYYAQTPDVKYWFRSTGAIDYIRRKHEV